ncbi:MAG TPA: hypothetical protein DEH22_12260 [Chloroflexi bacterium]|nr:hypothetical protein [Chloroflexota bacterium]
MDHHSSPQISSFVLRFVQDEPINLTDQPLVRGSIRHIQTDQERAFTQWADAVDFMRQFIPAEIFAESLKNDGER